MTRRGNLNYRKPSASPARAARRAASRGRRPLDLGAAAHMIKLGTCSLVDGAAGVHALQDQLRVELEDRAGAARLTDIEFRGWQGFRRCQEVLDWLVEAEAAGDVSLVRDALDRLQEDAILVVATCQVSETPLRVASDG